MKVISKLSILLLAYFAVVFISSCCDNSDAALNGNINTVILLDYDVTPEAINNDVIKTGFKLNYFPTTDLVFMNFNPTPAVYGQDCSSTVVNALDNTTVAISFSKDVTIGTNTFNAGSNLLYLNQFSSVEISDNCATRTFCEFTIGFPTALVQSMSVEDGPLTINFTAQTDDGIVFDHDFETSIDLQ